MRILLLLLIWISQAAAQNVTCVYSQSFPISVSNCRINRVNNTLMCRIDNLPQHPNSPNPPNRPNKPNPPNSPNSPNPPNPSLVSSPTPKAPTPPLQQSTTISGEVESFISHDHDESPSQNTFSLRTDTSNLSSVSSIGLRFRDPSIVSLVTGDNINIKLKTRRRGLLSDGITGISELSALDLEGAEIEKTGTTGAKDFVVDGKPVNITSITMVVSMLCTITNKMSTDTLARRYFDMFAPQGHVTLQKYHATCSYNKLLFLPENNIIVDNITLPCTGTYNKVQYDSANLCTGNEIYGWMNDALAQAKARKIDISKYKRRILILPFRKKCPWAGLASVGCTSSCMTWINNSPTSPEISMPTLFQELAHNIGLMHSNKEEKFVSIEYGDCTDPMGCGGPNPTRLLTTMTCINGPQQYKAGWAKPTTNGQIDFSQIEEGIPVVRVIPSMSVSDSNMIRIKVSDLPPLSSTPQQHAIFITYRTRQPDPGFDSGLTNDMTHKVYIHTYNITIRSPPRPDPSFTPFKPMLLAVLDPSATSQSAIKNMGGFPIKKQISWWFDTEHSGLNIKVVSRNDTEAIVSLCKYTMLTETSMDDCIDGVDNDCNGLIDADDPACFEVLGIPAFPPPLHPPLPPSPRPPRPLPPAPKYSRSPSPQKKMPPLPPKRRKSPPSPPRPPLPPPKLP